jgi:hypothetical protein
MRIIKKIYISSEENYKYKQKNKLFDENTFKFEIEYDKNLLNKNEIIRNSFSFFSKNS